MGGAWAFVSVGAVNGSFVGRPSPLVEKRTGKVCRVGAAKLVVASAGRPGGLWNDVKLATFTLLAGWGMVLGTRPANAKLLATVETTEQTSQTSQSETMKMIALGGAVLGALALKKKIDADRDSQEIEKRMKEQQEAFSEGNGPPIDLREIEQKQKIEQEMSTLDADREAVQDDDLMKELKQRWNKIQKERDPDAGDEDDGEKPGADGRQDYSSRGNTGSATLEPPSDSGEPRGRPRRPIQRPRRGPDARRRGAPRPQGRADRESSEARGGTVPREPTPEDGPEGEVSKENLDMLRRMWENSPEAEEGKSENGSKK